jgi:hypothetical protein
VPKETAQILFDALVGTLDFGSGFLDDDEVCALRDLAVLLGVDPLEATPQTYRVRMTHPFLASRPGGVCRWCAKIRDEAPHVD